MTNLFQENKFVVKVNQTNGRLVVTDPLTVKNQINDAPSVIAALRDVNTALKEDGATLVYNSNTEFYEVKLLTKLGNVASLTVTNTFIVNKLSANGSLGSPGMFLTSNGTSVYWSNDVDLVANNALFLNGKPEAYYTNATNMVAGTLNANLLPIIDGGFY
jgi:hypothetical protein